MALVGESGGEGDLGQGCFGVSELSSGELNPKSANVLADRLTNTLFEGRRQVHGMNFYLLGDFAQGQPL